MTAVRTLGALALGLSLVLGPGGAVSAGSNAGAYLAGRIAMNGNDFPNAARYFARALVQDMANIDLLEDTVLAYVGAGDFERAVVVARRLSALQAGNQIGNLVLAAEAVRAGRFDRAQELLAQDGDDAQLVGTLAQAWVLVGQGRMNAALESFDRLSERSGKHGFYLYHKALALAMVGDLEGAEAILSGGGGASLPGGRRGVLAHVQVLSRLERNDAALALISEAFGAERDPELEAVVARLEAGETLPLDAVRSAADGLAEVLYGLADALRGEVDDQVVLLHARLATYLRPDHVDAILLTARLLEEMGRHDLATAAYRQIPQDDPAYLAAELGRARALRNAGRAEAAIEVLQQLTRRYPGRPSVHVALGDAFRRQKDYEAASRAYDRAIALYDDADGVSWSLYYRRGITFERTGRWDRAEADFRKALQLNPGQPQVLNYLGYSFVEMKRNLEEALAMIEQAVSASPNDGYITDSLGWALYRLGRYDEAVRHMERAVALRPVDPVINDHLGDVYWAVGRKREARFQWRRALSFDPEPDEADRIRRKLQVGLDKVLEEEGAPPLALAADGN